jgi:hypothetical protein
MSAPAPIAWADCVESRLRAHLARKEALERELREVDGMIASESRRFADARGLRLRPDIPQLRHLLKMQPRHA